MSKKKMLAVFQKIASMYSLGIITSSEKSYLLESVKNDSEALVCIKCEEFIEGGYNPRFFQEIIKIIEGDNSYNGN